MVLVVAVGVGLGGFKVEAFGVLDGLRVAVLIRDGFVEGLIEGLAHW